MIQAPRVFALIPARGGSKGLPGKNIRPFAGLPLAAHSILFAKLCPEISRCIVSTDAMEIAEVARQFGAEVPFLRPAALAQDDTPMWPVIRHALAWVEAQGGLPYEYVLLLDPTSPAREPADVAEPFRLLGERPEADGVVGVSQPDSNPIWHAVVDRDGWMTDLIEINVTNLAGVPSIVYGLLALGFFVYGLGLGQSILTAGLTLALLILPVVIVATREAIRAIPAAIREGSYALGATRWQTTVHHILPYSMAGVITGVIIGMSRAIGETAPIITIGALTFIAFLPPAPVSAEPPFLSFEWLMSPFTVMPIQMFNWTSRPEAAFQHNAAAAGLVLVVMTLAMNGLAIYLRYRLRKNIKW